MEHRKEDGTTPSPGTLVLESNSHDVLLGRGKSSNNRPGNIQFRQLAIEASEKYLSSDTPEEKTAIAEQIIADVHERGGRFLRSVTASNAQGQLVGAWEVVIGDTVLAKVKQAIRDVAAAARRKEKRQEQRKRSKESAEQLEQQTEDAHGGRIERPDIPQPRSGSAATPSWLGHNIEISGLPQQLLNQHLQSPLPSQQQHLLQHSLPLERHPGETSFLLEQQRRLLGLQPQPYDFAGLGVVPTTTSHAPQPQHPWQHDIARLLEMTRANTSQQFTAAGLGGAATAGWHISRQQHQQPPQDAELLRLQQEATAAAVTFSQQQEDQVPSRPQQQQLLPWQVPRLEAASLLPPQGVQLQPSHTTGRYPGSQQPDDPLLRALLLQQQQPVGQQEQQHSLFVPVRPSPGAAAAQNQQPSPRKAHGTYASSRIMGQHRTDDVAVPAAGIRRQRSSSSSSSDHEPEAKRRSSTALRHRSFFRTEDESGYDDNPKDVVTAAVVLPRRQRNPSAAATEPSTDDDGEENVGV